MGKKLEFWGALGTAIYVIVISIKVFMEFDAFRELKLNELGDFLAGVFGPIAFLWLVLGFLQQGRELRISSASLHIQAVELTKAVEQYKELVEVNRKIFEADIEHRKHASLLRMKEVRPVFITELYGGSFGGDDNQINFLVKNIGGNLTKVKFNHPDAICSDVKYLPFMGRDQVVMFSLMFSGLGNNIAGAIKINYSDVDYREGLTEIRYTVQPANEQEQYPWIKFEYDEL